MNFFGKLLPIDGYYVTLNVSLPQNYTQSLHHLYQPLLGIEAINLYELLLEEANLMAHLSLKKQTHHTLMSHLNRPLNIIYDSLLKLEAIGLLRTYKKENESEKLYTYELIPPFAPRQFFNDYMLTELLQRQIGKQRLLQLKDYYVQGVAHDKGTEVTASFNEVFQTYEPSGEMPMTSHETIQTEPEIALVPIDFKLLADSLRQRNIPISRVLTETNERIITQVANLYDLELYEIEKALHWALTDENTLDIEQFKGACHDFFKNKENTSKIKLTYKLTKQNSERNEPKRKLSKKEQLIRRFETITPKQLLEDLSEGRHASEQDLKMIREIMVKQGLPTPVMNVLIHFTLLKTNMQLSRPYMEKIASHWSRTKLKTAAEAMEFALRQVNEPRQTKKQTYKRSQPNREEVIPDWFHDRNNKQEKEKANPLSKEDEKAQEELAAILKKYQSN